ncbi:sensor domain-containing protein [Rhabdothermincola salaria]|uniref:sensor domain-containing protein n=1 Tax=Rhabdothermincola salaria TaxID=2903142 RepID=UPI001E417466|nr:EAL domain-containing protein [Rhabdothermincola salaria]MCD9622280.1 EAL domain-containing protein [Rhabdothermincola salaria]
MTEPSGPGGTSPGRKADPSTSSGDPAQIRSFVARDAEADARQAARRAHAEASALLRHSRDVVAILETDYSVRWISESIEDLTGHPAERYLGSLHLDVHPDDLQVAIEQAEASGLSRPGATTLYTMRLAHRLGGWRWCEMHLSNQLDDPLVRGLVANFHDITRRKAATDDAAFQAHLLASVGDAVVAADDEGRITYMNRAALRFGGWSLEEVVGQPVPEVFPRPTAGEAIHDVMRTVRDGHPWSGELAFDLPDGRRRWIMANLAQIREGQGAGGVIGVATDITSQVRDRQHLESRERMQSEVSRLGQMALATHELGAVAAAIADSAGQTLGLDACAIAEHVGDDQSLIRASWGSYPFPVGTAPVTSGKLDLQRLVDDLDGPLLVEDFETDPRFMDALPEEGSEYRSGVIVRIGSPTRRFGTLTALSVEHRGFPAHERRFLESLTTILSTAVERAEADRRLTQMGLHDTLTGLPNRVLLRERIDRATARTARRDRTLAVLLVDLDRFKLLNDAMGHGAGDRLLVAVARRLQHAVATSDTVARLGGDEFAVLCESAEDLDDVFDLASNLSTALAPPFEIDGTEVFVTASIGISAHRSGTTTSDTFLREADAAMYRAKDSGRAGYEVYNPALQERAAHRLDTTTALRRALDRDELTVAWQPEVPLSGDPEGDPHADPHGDLGRGELWAEALVRWNHPQLGVVGPAAFIELAEETGLIVPLGEVVLHAALRQLRTWLSQDDGSPRRISINLSPRQLSQSALVGTVEAALAEHDIDPTHVVFEITESAVMENPDAAVRRLNELHDLGLGLAVDDFGTGYSSLSYLRRLPVSQLKIDRAFISGVTHHEADEAIVRGTIELAHALGLVVVAEGVETVEQRARLLEMGCDRAQGYLWSRPVPATELDHILIELSSHRR